MKKLLLTLMSTLLLIINVHAQAELQDLIEKAPIIIEGEIVEQNTFVSEQNGKIYTNNKILINKIFKGELDNDYFHIITLGGEYNDEFHSWSHSFNFGGKASGLFFLKPPIHPVSRGNAFNFELEGGKQGFMPYIPNSRNISPKVVLPSGDFLEDIPKQLYQRIETQTGIPKQDLSSNPYERDLNQLLSIEGDECVEYRILNLIINQNASSSEASSYSVEFDVKIRSLENTINLERTELSMEYSTSLFGSNVISNNNMNISLGGDLSNFQTVLTDETSSKAKIEIARIPNTNVLTIDNYGKQLYHAVINVENFNPIEILQLTVDENFDISTYKIEDEVVSEMLCNTFNGDVNAPISAFFTPSISFVSPNSAPAGTRFVNSLITITGNDFGDQRGDSRVNFQVLQGTGGYEWCAPLDGDYVSWNSTTIELLVPSYAKPPLFTDAQVGQETLQYPGSGRIRIDKVIDGMHVYSDVESNPNAQLDIPYSVENDKGLYPEGDKGQPEFLTKQNGNGGYTIQFSSEFKFIHDEDGNNTNVLRRVEEENAAGEIIFGDTYIDIAKEVAEKWQCLTGLNFVVDEETTWFEQFGCEEGNIIGLNYGPDLEPNSSDVMSTKRRSLENTTCLTPGMDIETDFLRCAEIYVVKEEFDNLDVIVVGTLENTKERFFNSLLHEFGHAHYLYHVSSSSELMHPELIAGSTATITPNALLASRHIQDFSTEHNCEEGNYVLHECYSPNSVEEVEKNPKNWFKVFTNSEDIIIQKKNVANIKEIRIFDILGRMHGRHLISHSDETIQIPKVRTSGVYIVTIRDDADILYSFKISQL